VRATFGRYTFGESNAPNKLTVQIDDRMMHKVIIVRNDFEFLKNNIYNDKENSGI
jgi:hypothetical protein